MERMAFKSVKELRKFLKEKFGKEAVKSLGLSIKVYSSLGLYSINLKKALGWAGNRYIFDKDIELTKEEKELVKFLENTVFYIED